MAAPTTDTILWVARALGNDPVWNIGQLDAATVRALDKQVKAGRLLKDRVSWMGISPLKTVWFHPDRPPQEVMRKQWYAQQAAKAAV